MYISLPKGHQVRYKSMLLVFQLEYEVNAVCTHPSLSGRNRQILTH